MEGRAKQVLCEGRGAHGLRRSPAYTGLAVTVIGDDRRGCRRASRRNCRLAFTASTALRGGILAVREKMKMEGRSQVCERLRPATVSSSTLAVTTTRP